MRLSVRVSPRLMRGAAMKSGVRWPGCGFALKMNLSAPAIWPEIAAEAPTTGAMSP